MLSNFLSHRLSFSNNFIILEREIMVLADLSLARDSTSSSSSLPFLQDSMIFD
jgi:hypothetical protein